MSAERLGQCIRDALSSDTWSSVTEFAHGRPTDGRDLRVGLSCVKNSLQPHQLPRFFRPLRHGRPVFLLRRFDRVAEV